MASGGRNFLKSSCRSRGQPSEAFLVKCAKEKEKLRRQLDIDLRRSMQELLSHETSSDLTVISTPNSTTNKVSSKFRVHSALLKGRVPNFYKQCLPEGIEQSTVTLPVDKKQLASFLKKVYCDDDIRMSEVSLVDAIKRSLENNSKARNEISPSGYFGDSSDAYLTPQSSLSNITEAFEERLMETDGNLQSIDHSVLFSPPSTNLLSTEKNYGGSKEQRDIKVINSLFSVNKDELPFARSLTDSGFMSQNTSVHAGVDFSNNLNEPKSSPVYMFVDINEVEVPCEKKESAPKPAVNPLKPQPIAMFIDLNDAELPPKVACPVASTEAVEGKFPKPISMFIESKISPIQPELQKFDENEATLRRSSSYKINNKENVCHQNTGAACRHGIYVPQDYSAKPIKQDVGHKIAAEKKIEEGLLLPMSPIMKRKNQREEKATPDLKVSIRPQDIDSFAVNKRVSLNSQKPVASPQPNPNCGNLIQRSKEEVMLKLKPRTIQNICNAAELDDLTPSPPSEGSPVSTTHRSNEALSSPPEEEENVKTMSTSYGDVKLSSQIHAKFALSAESSPAKQPLLRPNSHIEQISKEDNQASSDFEEDTETIYSEISDLSSLGAFSNSTVTLHSSQRGTMTAEEERRRQYRLRCPCSKLGEDLLKMFLEEINTDVIIEVAGRDIKAHRCILSSRSQYFSVMWKNETGSESSKNRISLPGFSYENVHFALCHIYSGATNIADKSNITELALIADMLGLDGLKDVIVFHLKMSFCHFFHKPCNSCVIGVSECLPITSTYGLTELQDKAVKWIGKYYAKVWPTKAFANLPEELIEKCYFATISSLNADNVIEMILSCDMLSSTLPQVKWSEPIFSLASRLLCDCTKFISERFDALLNNDNFFLLGKGMSWNVTAVEDIIMSAVDSISPDVACRSYVMLNRILPLAEAADCSTKMEWTENFLSFLRRIHRQCERYLINNANKIAHCSSWPLLTVEIQQKIKDAAVIVFEFGKPIAAPPRLSSLKRSFSKKSKEETTNKISSNLEEKSHVLTETEMETSQNKTLATPTKTNETKKQDVPIPSVHFEQPTLNVQGDEKLLKSVNGKHVNTNTFTKNKESKVTPKKQLTKNNINENTSKPVSRTPNSTSKTAFRLTNTSHQSASKFANKNHPVHSSSLTNMKAVRNFPITKSRSGNDRIIENIQLPDIINDSEGIDSHKEKEEKTISESSHDDETRYEAEISSVTSSEWDVTEMTSKTIKEAEFLENALTKKIESQINDEPPRDRTFTRKSAARGKPISSQALGTPNVDPARLRNRPKSSVKVTSSTNSTKSQTTKVSSSLSKVTKETNNQRKSHRFTVPKCK